MKTLNSAYNILILFVIVHFVNTCKELWFNECENNENCCSGFCDKLENWVHGVCKVRSMTKYFLFKILLTKTE